MNEDSAASTSGLYRRLVSGSMWMVAARWSLHGVGVLNIIVLARLLTPQDFGIIAMSAVVIGFFELSARLGVDSVLIRHSNATPEHFNTGWTIRLLQRLVLALLIALSAPLAASYFGEPRVESIIQVLALGFAFSGFENIGIVYFRKDLDFSRDFRFSLYGRLIRAAITIALAVVWRSYWALAIGMVAGTLFEVILSYTMHTFRPRLSLRHWREFVSFAIWTMPIGVATFLNNRTDFLVVGGLGNTAIMGSYNVASEVSNMTTSETVTSVSRALLPGYAKVKHSWPQLREMFLNVVATAAILSFALGLGLAVLASDFVAVVLGSQWGSAIPLVRFLAVSAMMTSLSRILTVQIFVLTGHERRLFFLTWLQLALILPAVVVGGQLGGAEGVAAARAGTAAMLVPVSIYFLVRTVDLSVIQILSVLWRPLVAALAMVGLVRLFEANTTFVPYLSLPLGVAIGAIAFLGVLGILWAASRRPVGPESFAFNFLLQRVRVRSDRE